MRGVWQSHVTSMTDISSRSTSTINRRSAIETLCGGDEMDYRPVTSAAGPSCDGKPSQARQSLAESPQDRNPDLG